MVKNKLNIGLVFGGKSVEHDISILSAKSIRKHLDPSKYNCIDIFVDKNGRFNLPKEKIDVFFPIIHGTFGEDGRLQGYFETLQVPYVGASVLGSAIGIDKDVQKRLLNYAKIKTAKYLIFNKNQKIDLNKLIKFIKFPLFIKPNSLGSSVGITKVLKSSQLKKAIDTAFKYDEKILVEECIYGRELEISVLGDLTKPKASVVGEVIPDGRCSFYDYSAKYDLKCGTRLIIPANLDQDLTARIQKIAIKTFKVLNCYGFARVDMFLNDKNEAIVNEINTIPGFTDVSMFPKLLDATGISFSDILNKLINLGIKRYKQGEQLNYKIK